jgi:nucleotide-binding universal stress UspA family protein
MLYERILVGTDGSPTAAKAVDRAVELARSTGATLTIVSVGGGKRPAEIVARESARHSASGVAISTEVRAGDPAGVLADLAERDGYDLLVVGNKGMAGAARFFLGSVPNKVSHHVPSSMLIVHTT